MLSLVTNRGTPTFYGYLNLSHTVFAYPTTFVRHRTRRITNIFLYVHMFRDSHINNNHVEDVITNMNLFLFTFILFLLYFILPPSWSNLCLYFYPSEDTRNPGFVRFSLDLYSLYWFGLGWILYVYCITQSYKERSQSETDFLLLQISTHSVQETLIRDSTSKYTSSK